MRTMPVRMVKHAYIVRFNRFNNKDCFDEMRLVNAIATRIMQCYVLYTSVQAFMRHSLIGDYVVSTLKWLFRTTVFGCIMWLRCVCVCVARDVYVIGSACLFTAIENKLHNNIIACDIYVNRISNINGLKI